MRKNYKGLLAIILTLVVAGCSSSPPRNINDGCEIFSEKDDWYEHAHDSYKKWGVPVHVQLAIIHQESKFRDDAKPERDTLLWIIPWFRKSSAFGFAQVKDATWDWYIDKTGNWGADRDEFEDAVDFIGWYGNMSHKTLGISKWDTYNQYLAYHEGHGGFKRKTYNKKKWLIGVARKVERRAKSYGAQLKRCEGDLDSGWSLWPF
ncbi:hypothetical protein BOW53_14430 [Solemya pervernicosa gill symbiont]|uniref:Transglycosylase SLT domain-containing protein n=2 Tax=Gammaproteobacteria incertae sedis TaxID=118884 RepID=A0A1T2L0T4_9GAMM|nr:transglycosylase SLT domain-containing protein [Candidatus Reidiella endopervernicosa]OOZ38717.1 hypothetical protein BOW53_14430 [Solemya pervernicosa gill symbiont]QKQ25828.1 transglycosylase SLT domain-containing protein [Candidatus Reidiella endopervernicosa]